MTTLLWISALISGGLFIYLFFALLFPEKLS